MNVGDKVFTADVLHSDTGPLVLVYERTVTSLISEGVVCQTGTGTHYAVFTPDKLFPDREAANARAIDLIREGLAKITTNYSRAIDKLLTSTPAVV